MSESIGPAIARDRLRVRLRDIREAGGLSPAEVAQRLSWPASTIDEMESGALLLSPLEAEALLGLYEVDGREAEHLLLLARVARSRRWWARHGMTDEYQDFVAYEVEASRISVYEPLVVPGLLQTPRYALAVTAAILRRPEDDPDVVARAQVRAERQRSVADRVAAGDDLTIVAILDEIVLRRRVGGADVMREQLEHLVAEARRDHVTLVVMPTGLGGHAGLGGIFELLEFAGDPHMSTVLIESAVSDHNLRGTRVTAFYRQVVADLVAAGRGGDEAVALVRSILDEPPG